MAHWQIGGYAYNEIGQMLSDGTTTYQYDAYGNLQYEIRVSDDMI